MEVQGAEVFRWSVRAYAEKEVEIRREYNNIIAIDWESTVVSTADMRLGKNKGESSYKRKEEKAADAQDFGGQGKRVMNDE